MPDDLNEFFSLIAKAKKEKEEEIKKTREELIGEVDFGTIFSELAEIKKQDKKDQEEKEKNEKIKRVKEKKQIEALESWLYGEPKPIQSTEEIIEEEIVEEKSEIESEDVIEEDILIEEESIEEKVEEDDNVDHALKILETIKSKEEIRENLDDPEILKIRRELEYIKNLVNAQGGGGEVRLEFLDDIDRSTALIDGRVLKYDSSAGIWTGAVVTEGGGISGIDTTGTSSFNHLNVTGLSTFLNDIHMKKLGEASSHELRFGTPSLTELKISHTGTNGSIFNLNGDLLITSTDIAGGTGAGISMKAFDDITLSVKDGEDGINIIGDGAVELYYDNSKKFETTSTGINVTGHTETDTLNVSGVSTFQSHVNLGDDDELRFGANNDFKIVHDPNDCRFENSNGDIKFKNTGDYFFFDEDGGETLASFINDGSCNLFFNGSRKIQTNSTGVNVLGITETDHLNVTGVGTFTDGVTSGTGGPVKISVTGTTLTFTVDGVGSASLTLS